MAIESTAVRFGGELAALRKESGVATNRLEMAELQLDAANQQLQGEVQNVLEALWRAEPEGERASRWLNPTYPTYPKRPNGPFVGCGFETFFSLESD